MSAFLVTREHIDLIVAAVEAWDRFDEFVDFEELGQTLWQENARSVAYRYPNHPAPVVRYKCRPGRYPEPDPVVVLKQIACLRYQSCERPDWEESRACKLLGRIEWLVISQLPGFAEAPWGIDGPSVAAARAALARERRQS